MDPVQIALIVGFVILSLSIHEWAHAYVAHLLGDDTAKSLGRMTPNPIVHIDLMMTIILPALLLIASQGQMVFGGAKPVPVDPRNFKKPLGANALVAIAGPLSNCLLVFVFLVAYHLSLEYGGYQSSQLLPSVLLMSAYMNAILAFFNLIPIPPLDGSRVVMWALPRGMRPGYAMLERFGMLIIVILLVTGAIRPLIGSTVGEFTNWVNSVVLHAGTVTGLFGG